MSNKTKTLLANKISLKIIVFFCFFIDVYSQHNQASVYDLKSEHLVNPIGLDVKAPRLTWKINDSRREAIQKSYDISVGTDSIKVAAGNGSYWNTGKINSSTQMVVYDGKQLKPYQKYYWLLKVWDKNNQKMKSEKLASFEMGMMDIINWKGSWISDSWDKNKKEGPYFRYEFSAQKK